MTLKRKNALFAGSDGGAHHWATIATLIETCKLNDIDPLSYLTDVLARIVNGHPNRDIDALLPWAYRKQVLKARGLRTSLTFQLKRVSTLVREARVKTERLFRPHLPEDLFVSPIGLSLPPQRTRLLKSSGSRHANSERNLTKPV